MKQILDFGFWILDSVNRKSKIQNLKFVALIVLLCYSRFHTVAEACPGCKEALFDPSQLPQRLSTARGYALSIGLLLVVPAGLVGGIALRIAQTRRRHPPQL